MTRPATHQAWWRNLTLDLTPLRDYPAFRLLWGGQLITILGSQIRHVVIAYHVFVLTDSSFAVGMIGVFQAVPLIAFTIFGGVIADAVDRRKLMFFTQSGLIATMLTLAWATSSGRVSVVFLYAMTSVAATLFALDGPARHSLIPTLVDKHRIPQAMALNQVLVQTAFVLGPALGGVVIAGFGLTAGYLINAATFSFGIVIVALLKAPMRTPGGASAGLESLVEGFRYLRRSPIILSVLALDFAATLLAWPRAMLPFFAENVFGVGPQGYGLLVAAPGAGALIGALTGGWVTRVRSRGVTVAILIAVYGAAIGAFGLLSSGFALALLLLSIAGAADVANAILRSTIVQTSVPDNLRGRITAVNLTVVISGPRLGEMRSGIVAAASSPQAAVVSGGIACVVLAVFAVLARPKLFKEGRQEDPTLRGGDAAG